MCVARLLVQSPQDPSSLTHACHDLPAALPLGRPPRGVTHLIAERNLAVWQKGFNSAFPSPLFEALEYLLF